MYGKMIRKELAWVLISMGLFFLLLVVTGCSSLQGYPYVGTYNQRMTGQYAPGSGAQPVYGVPSGGGYYGTGRGRR